MSNLAKALQKYYRRKNTKSVIFNNGQSLSDLSLTMWENLDYKQIDSSVLSRVLQGERLFNGKQLEIFCKILNIQKHDKEYLFSCLSEDYNKKKGFSLYNSSISPSLGYEITRNLVESSFQTLSEGNLDQLINKCDITQTFIDSIQVKSENSYKKRFVELYAATLYLKGRVTECLSLPQTVVKQTLEISNQLIKMGEANKNITIKAYGYILLANAYYLAGGYSYSNSKYRFYQKAISIGMKILNELDDDNNEKLYILRVVAASSIYTKDKETMTHIVNKTKNIIPMQPLSNKAGAIHLCTTLTKGLAYFNDSDPFSIKESAIKYFHDDLTNKGIYEVSSIKEEIDTLLALKTKESNYIKDRLKRGISIADKNNYIRHTAYFNKINKII